MPDVPHIGLLPQGGKNWIAGVVYLQNIISAVGKLPVEERPRLSMLMELLQERSVPVDARPHFPEFLYYTYKRHTPFQEKLWLIKFSLQSRRLPISFEKLVVNKEIDAIFPVQESLGKNFSVPWIGWVPDFQHKRMPQYFKPDDINVRNQSYAAIIQDASHVIVSSQDAYNDLMTFFPTDKSRVSVFRFTSVLSDDCFSTDPAATVDEYKLPQKFLMFPSQFWVHKNHRIVFEALKILKDKKMNHINLVLTGHNFDYRAPEHFNEMMALKDTYGLQMQVFYLGLLERHKQIQLMRAATAVLQPSYFEGWSALVEDARALGKTIYLSDIAVHHEQNPPDAIYFNPDNAQELAEVLARDYDRLSPGPDKTKEFAARARQNQQTLTFARDFLNIIQKAR